MRISYYLVMLLSLPILAFANGQPPTKSGNFLCNGGHYRCKSKPSEYKYHQFGMRHVDDFAGYSDLLHSGKPLEHYQSFLTELDSRRADTNAVAFWSDAAARVDRARVWGGFFSARSGLHSSEDAQLVGLEVDVLNGGKPGIHPNNSKVGVQIVGFGQINSNALEVLSESEKSGQFMNGLNFKKSAIHQAGTIIGAEPQKTTIGINMQHSTFKDSAILLSENAPITFRQDSRKDAKVFRDSGGALVLQTGDGGLRVTTPDGTDLWSIENDGFMSNTTILRQYKWVPALFLGALIVTVIIACLSMLQVHRLRQELRTREK